MCHLSRYIQLIMSRIGFPDLGLSRLSLDLFKVDVTSRSSKPGSRDSPGMQAHSLTNSWR